MARIDDRLVIDDLEDTAGVDAILALRYVKQFDGGGCADADAAERQLPEGAIEIAVQHGLLRKEHGFYVITPKGEKLYDEQDRHGLSFADHKNAEAVELEKAASLMVLSDGRRIEPQEHTIYFMKPDRKEKC